MRRNIVLTIFALFLAAMSGCKTSSDESGNVPTPEDTALTQKVKQALSSDALTRDAGIMVETVRGNVHLTGTVDHLIQKQRATELTRAIKEVQWFRNGIVVKNDLPDSGARISDGAGASQKPEQPESRD